MLILICGQPRAGKTTFSHYFDGICDIMHLDDFGGRCYERVIKHLPQTDVVVEGVYWRAEQRKALLNAYNGKAKCIYLDTSEKVKRTRNGYCKACEHEFEPPTYAEGWDDIIVIGDDNVESSNHTDET